MTLEMLQMAPAIPGVNWDQLELTGTFVTHTFRFRNEGSPDVLIGRFKLAGGRKVSIKGAADIELKEATKYCLRGRWGAYRDRRTGDTVPQFEYVAANEVFASDEDGTIRYLTHVGAAIHGFGDGLARGLYKAFGKNAVDTLRDRPELAAARVNRLPLRVAKAMSEELKRYGDRHQDTITLLTWFRGTDLPASAADAAVALWGDRALRVVQRNAYALARFHGCSFKRCDDLYLKLNNNRNSLRRQVLMLYEMMNSDRVGHVWFSFHDMAMQLQHRIVGAQLTRTLRLGCRAKLMRTQMRGGTQWIAMESSAAMEETAAEIVRSVNSRPSEWSHVAAELPGGLADRQKSAMHSALQGRIGCFCGVPGSGKTYAAVQLVKYLRSRRCSIGLASPTGKAATRMQGVLHDHNVSDIRVTTLHKMLGVAGVNAKHFTFKHGPGNPLPYKYIIVDEASMVNLYMYYSLLRAIGPDTHVLFVGDVNQLPPVGCGAPLRDMLEADVPRGMLEEVDVHRNNGAILHACAKIKNGGSFAAHPELDADNNLGYRATYNPVQTLDAVKELLDGAKRDGLDLHRDVQVLVAVNAKSQLSRRIVNTILQPMLNRRAVNSNGIMTALSCAREAVISDGDEMYTKGAENSVYVANGEQGVVIREGNGTVDIRLTDPQRDVRVPHPGRYVLDNTGNKHQSRWELAYAISCHKSQGSEWPMVIVILDDYEGAKYVCDRAWLYTAISRAQHRCWLVGNPSLVESFCCNTRKPRRKTFLVEQLQRQDA